MMWKSILVQLVHLNNLDNANLDNVTKNRTNRYSPEILSANHVGKENPVSIGSVARIFLTEGGGAVVYTCKLK
jgi:hypothetical protein